MQRDNLEWLDHWYQSQCDGVWEHRRGLRLEPLEQQGWQLTIDLAGTEAAAATPRRLLLDTPCGEWLHCSIAEERFSGSGDPHKLEQIIGVFRRWVEAGA